MGEHSTLRQHRESSSEDEDLEALLVSTEDVELESLRARYRTEFRDAFGAALASLDPEQRNVLRHHLIDRLNAVVSSPPVTSMMRVAPGTEGIGTRASSAAGRTLCTVASPSSKNGELLGATIRGRVALGTCWGCGGSGGHWLPGQQNVCVRRRSSMRKRWVVRASRVLQLSGR